MNTGLDKTSCVLIASPSKDAFVSNSNYLLYNSSLQVTMSELCSLLYFYVCLLSDEISILSFVISLKQHRIIIFKRKVSCQCIF